MRGNYREISSARESGLFKRVTQPVTAIYKKAIQLFPIVQGHCFQPLLAPAIL